MSIFRFRLAPVLRLRERHRETQRLAFAAVEEERLRIVDEIQRLEERLSAYSREMTRADGTTLSVVDFQLYGDFVQRLDRTLQLKHDLLRKVEEKREVQRLELLEADTGVKSLEQLKNRLAERHLREEATTAQQQADEVGRQKYLMQQRAVEEKAER